MAYDISIDKSDNLGDIETKLGQAKARAGATSQMFRARIPSDHRSAFFKDIWTATAVASGMNGHPATELVAWGLKDWSNQDDEEGFALSYPCLIALQRGARVITDAKSHLELDGLHVKRSISRLGGVIGGGARQRTVVELDPDFPSAARLTSGPRRRDAFFEFVRGVLVDLEIGPMARKPFAPAARENPAKGTILEFLYELHANASEHGRATSNARFLRLQKHQYPHRDAAMSRAPHFEELTTYLASQPAKPSNGMFNLVEASVSDFGPGIVDGFLPSFAGGGHRQRPREDVLEDLLHKQLSSKSSDPNAGLGIGQALAAAREMDAFVSLRTGEFWLTMQGRASDGARLKFRPGPFPQVVGTHWQLLLPDRSAGADRA
jgi:hypothetical protein